MMPVSAVFSPGTTPPDRAARPWPGPGVNGRGRACPANTTVPSNHWPGSSHADQTEKPAGGASSTGKVTFSRHGVSINFNTPSTGVFTRFQNLPQEQRLRLAPRLA